jgi:AcrR family transcriptional regulator
MAIESEAAAEEELGLRERKKQRTRETLVRIALQLFAENGFHETTLKQIADAAEVAPRTLSAYFPVKEELVFHDHDEVFDGLEARLRDREPGERAADALRAWILRYLESTRPDEFERTRCRRELIESDPALRTYERGLQERVEGIVARAVAVDLGLPEDDLVPHMVGAATMAALDALGREMKETGATSEEFRTQGRLLLDQAMAFIGAGVQGLADLRR